MSYIPRQQLTSQFLNSTLSDSTLMPKWRLFIMRLTQRQSWCNISWTIIALTSSKLRAFLKAIYCCQSINKTYLLPPLHLNEITIILFRIFPTSCYHRVFTVPCPSFFLSHFSLYSICRFSSFLISLKTCFESITF